MQVNWGVAAAVAATVIAGNATTAQAQRANENAVTKAEDAFGTQVGNENVGLYGTQSARGFSPEQAGNLRIEGLYFDQQARFGNRISKGTVMRVGLSALSYPFPAPTGIGDIQLRIPGDDTQASAAISYSYPTGQPQASVSSDAEIAAIPGRLGVGISASVYRRVAEWRGGNTGFNGGATLHWTPNDNVEVIPLLTLNLQLKDEETQPLILSGGAYLPPEVDRGTFTSQQWAAHETTDYNAGVIVRADVMSDWRLQVGLFRSSREEPKNVTLFYRNVQPAGAASLDAFADPAQSKLSHSGEVRLTRVFSDGVRQHTVHVSTKGRDVKRVFGGGAAAVIGPATLGVYTPLPEPAFTFGPSSQDKARQVSPGISYIGSWPGVGDISFGVQKAFYRRDVTQPNLPRASTTSSPWIYNGTVTLFATDALAFYSSFTRGLEESGIAPENASNRGEALPASLTKQVDAGIRYRITSRLTLLAGVFEVTKPYFDRDAANLFTSVGDIRHRGVEVSLAGQPVPDLTVVAGVMLLQPRVSGSTVDRGLIAPVPPGRPPQLIRFNANYAPPAWHGLSLETQIDHKGANFADRINTFKVPAATLVDVGGRYKFDAFGSAASLRLQVQNLTNAFGWSVNGSSGSFTYEGSRRFSARLAVDF
ncbi:MAG: TonB-dependent receptor [Rhodospirillaceae bacterium]|nr:TonB-dependent receptor [Rhodospirillaceae bacterium]